PYTGRYEAGSIIETLVASHDAAFHLTTLRFPGGELVVPQLEAAVGERVRPRIRARDVSLAIERPSGISILNVLCARIAAITDESGPVVDLELAIGEARLIAGVTQRWRGGRG